MKSQKNLLYYLEDEKILAYMKLTDEEKMKWLEEVRVFNREVFSEEELELRKKLMKDT
jgi:hypothetical protein